MQQPLTTHILASGTTMAHLCHVMQQAGYARTSAFHVQGETEPDRVIWERASDTVTGIVDLATRNLVIVGPSGFGPPAGLRLATRTHARNLLSKPDTVSTLAGLQIAESLADPSLAEWIMPHIRHHDTTIATKAAEVFAAIAGSDATDIDPGAALFSVPGWRQEKLQLLRWLRADPPEEPELLASLLAKAITDDDWEIAVTAMLTVARLNCKATAAAVRRMVLPRTRQDGLSSDEVRLVAALRDGALQHLGAGNNPRLPAGILAALTGDPAQLPARFGPVFHALSQPLPDQAPEPDAHPDIRRTETGPQLADGTPLVWVPPCAHWVGDGALKDGPPARLVTPDTGFFINALPLSPMPYAAARAHVDQLNDRLTLYAALPNSDEWDMAARGPDGRRFLWGMNARSRQRTDLSPWGMAGILQSPGEWLNATSNADTCLATGGSKSPVISTRQSVAADKELCARVVFKVL